MLTILLSVAILPECCKCYNFWRRGAETYFPLSMHMYSTNAASNSRWRLHFCVAAMFFIIFIIFFSNLHETHLKKYWVLFSSISSISFTQNLSILYQSDFLWIKKSSSLRIEHITFFINSNSENLVGIIIIFLWYRICKKAFSRKPISYVIWGVWPRGQSCWPHLQRLAKLESWTM